MSDDAPPSGNGQSLTPAQRERKRVDGIVSSILLDYEGDTTEARLADAVTHRRTGNDEIDRRVLERVLLVWANMASRSARPDEEEDVPEYPEPVLKAARLFVRELERHCRTWAILTVNFVESGPFDARLIPEGVRSSTPGSIGSPHATATQGRSSNRRSSSSRPITPTEGWASFA